MEKSGIRPIDLTQLQFSLISALDGSLQGDFSVETVSDWINKGSAIPEFAEQAKEVDDFLISLPRDEIAQEIEARWRGLLHAYGTTKFGVRNNGLALMAALTNELLQEGFNAEEGKWSSESLAVPLEKGAL